MYSNASPCLEITIGPEQQLCLDDEPCKKVYQASNLLNAFNLKSKVDAFCAFCILNRAGEPVARGRIFHASLSAPNFSKFRLSDPGIFKL